MANVSNSITTKKTTGKTLIVVVFILGMLMIAMYQCGGREVPSDVPELNGANVRTAIYALLDRPPSSDVMEVVKIRRINANLAEAEIEFNNFQFTAMNGEYYFYDGKGGTYISKANGVWTLSTIHTDGDPSSLYAEKRRGGTFSGSGTPVVIH